VLRIKRFQVHRLPLIGSTILALLLVVGVTGCGSSVEETVDYIPQNKFVIEPQYDNYTNFFSEGLAPVYENSSDPNQRAGFIDLDGKLVIPMTFDYVGNFNSGLAVASKNKKVGYIDASGTYVIAPQFDYAEDFSEGVAAVCYSNDGFQCGYIDTKGKLITPLDITSMDYQTQASEGYFTACHGSMDDCRYIFTKTDGTPANFGSFTWAEPFSEGFAAVQQTVGNDSLWGFINKKGDLVVKPMFTWVGKFGSGLAPVCIGTSTENCTIGFINTSGEFEINPQYEYFEFYDSESSWGNYPQHGFFEGLARVMVDQKVGYIDSTGKMVIQPQFNYGGNFVNGLARVTVNGKMGFINKKGVLVVPAIYDSAFNFYQGRAAVEVDGKWGFIS
jgi:hypothetical protein